MEFLLFEMPEGLHVVTRANRRVGERGSQILRRFPPPDALREFADCDELQSLCLADAANPHIVLHAVMRESQQTLAAWL